MLRRQGFTEDRVQFNSARLSLLRRVRTVTGFPTGYTYMGRARHDRLSRVASSGVDVAVLARDDISSYWVDYAAERGLELGARAHSISSAWALSAGVRRMVVDRWSWTCTIDPTPDPELPVDIT